MIRRIARAWLLLGLLFGVSAGAGEAPETLLLLTLDTTRADHLSGYGYRRTTSPALDALGERGLRVRRAVSPMPATDPAHLTMLTGLYPRSHGVRLNGVPLPDPGIPNLAKWAKAEGYRTAAFVSRQHLVPSQLDLEGFDFESGPEGARRGGDETLAAAKEWLGQTAADERLFLWIHFFEPHAPYAPPEPFGEKFTEPERWSRLGYGTKTLGREMNRHRVDLYDGEIAYLDTLVDETVEWIRARVPEGGSPLIVIAADHGEILDELFERTGRAFLHANLLSAGSLMVPLILNWEGRIDPGQILEGPVELTDIAPTIFELTGRKGFSSQGTSLVARNRGEAAGDSGYAFSEREVFTRSRQWEYRSTEQFAVTSGRYQLIVTEPFGRTELYDLERDPGVSNDLSDRLPEVRKRLLARLRSWIDSVPERAYQGGEIPADKVEALRALGYIE
jgi:arylsulfatase A-like enzyme